MTIERRRPLPVGRYWADIFPKNRPAFDAWLKVNTERASVVSSQFFPLVDGAPEHDWVLFATSAETLWPDDVLGFAPNVASEGTNSSDDTVQKPPPEPSITDQASAALSRMTGAIYLAAGGIAACGVLVLLLALNKRRK